MLGFPNYGDKRATE